MHKYTHLKKMFKITIACLKWVLGVLLHFRVLGTFLHLEHSCLFNQVMSFLKKLIYENQRTAT